MQMINKLLAPLMGLLAMVAAFFWGRSDQKAKHNKEKSEAAYGEAQEWSDVPVTPYDTIKRLRERAKRKS